MEGGAQCWRPRPQGRERRRKRPGPSPRGGNGQNNQNKRQINQGDRSDFHFSVEIPQHYKIVKRDASASGISESLLADGPSVGLDADTNNNTHQPMKEDAGEDTKLPAGNKSDNLPEEFSSSKQPETRAKGEGGNEEDTKSAKHNKFIAALEKYGSSEGAWRAMSSDLGWPVEDVKLHAYSYFKSLVHDRKRKIYDKLVDCKKECTKKNKNTGKSPDRKAPSAKGAWSFHELLLLDSLMMKYCKDMSVLDVTDASNNVGKKVSESSHCLKQQMTPWEKIASQLPGKTSKECQKEGISRLLKVYDEGRRLDLTSSGKCVWK